MLQENINQDPKLTELPGEDQIHNINDPSQILSYQVQQKKSTFLEDSSSESDEDLFMLQISQKVEQMDNEGENNNEVPRTRNEKLVKQKVDEKPETKEERELKFSFSSDNSPQLLEIGYLECIMNDSIIIHPGSTGVTLNLDQLVITESKEILGVIEDVFGRIETPHYRILNDTYTQNLIKEEKIILHQKLYIDSSNKKLLCQDHLILLMKYKYFTISLRKKGCDASNQFDEEVDDREKEYSDDENEQVHKSKKKKNRNDKGKKDEQGKPEQSRQQIPKDQNQQHTIPSSNPHHHQNQQRHLNNNSNQQFPNQNQHPKQQFQQQQQQQRQQFPQNQYPNQQMNQQNFQNQPFHNQYANQQQQSTQYANQQQQQYLPQQNNQLPPQLVQIGAQYFTMLPGGIPNLLNPKAENPK